MQATIYHNPRCSKSRRALELLKERGVTTDIILYLENAPKAEELAEVIQRLGIRPAELMRKSEVPYKEHVKGKDLSDSELIRLMSQYPIMIERPIVIGNNRAIIARPPETLLEIF